MSGERLGVSAPGLEVQHRCLDLDEAAVVQRSTEAGDGGVADLEVAARLLVDDQVGIPLPETGVGVGEAVPLVGQRAHRLREQLHAVDLDRELAGASGHDLAVDTDPVAEIELLDVVEDLVADDRLRHEQLDLPVTVANGREHELAGVSVEHRRVRRHRPRRRSRSRARARPTRRAPRRACATGRSGRDTARRRAGGARPRDPGDASARRPDHCRPAVRRRREARCWTVHSRGSDGSPSYRGDTVWWSGRRSLAQVMSAPAPGPDSRRARAVAILRGSPPSSSRRSEARRRSPPGSTPAPRPAPPPIASTAGSTTSP